jgi:CBS domain-containing protein
MAEKKIGCIPVVSAGTLVGLVTTTDILRYVEGLA